MAESGFLDREVTVDGKPSRYVVFVPKGLDPKGLPVILFLHGYGESGSDGLLQTAVGLGHAIQRNRTQWPFLVVFPQKPVFESLWPNYVPLLDSILQHVEAEFAPDTHRRYLTGLSQGGHGTFQLAKALAWRFAAIAPVCGWADDEVGERLLDIPVWAFHGDDDEAVKVSASIQAIDAIEKAGGRAKLTRYPGVGHNSWDAAYQNEKLGEWFLQHDHT
jgi:predicted peptidase